MPFLLEHSAALSLWQMMWESKLKITWLVSGNLRKDACLKWPDLGFLVCCVLLPCLQIKQAAGESGLWTGASGVEKHTQSWSCATSCRCFSWHPDGGAAPSPAPAQPMLTPAKRLALKWTERAKERIFYSSFSLFPCGTTPRNTPDVSKPFPSVPLRKGRRNYQSSGVKERELGTRALLPHTTWGGCCSCPACLGKAVNGGCRIRKPTWPTALRPLSPTALSVTEVKCNAGKHRGKRDWALESNCWFWIPAPPRTVWPWATNLSML